MLTETSASDLDRNLDKVTYKWFNNVKKFVHNMCT